jgi:hypothetical protein
MSRAGQRLPAAFRLDLDLDLDLDPQAFGSPELLGLTERKSSSGIVQNQVQVRAEVS